MLSHLLLLTFPMAMAFAGANDLFTMRIPNKVSVFLIASFVSVVLAIGMPLGSAALYVGLAAGVLLATFILFSFNLLGGGDAKLLAAGALWMGIDHVFEFLLLVTLFGGVLSGAVFLYRKYLPIANVSLPVWAEKLHENGTGIPYGIAIAAAGLAVYPSTELFRLLAGI